MAMFVLDDDLADGSLTIMNVFEPKMQEARKDSEKTIAYIAAFFLTPLHWQSINRLSRDAHRSIDAYWRCARRIVLEGLSMCALGDDRCEICGFLPGRRFANTFRQYMCYECGWGGICEDCTYVVPGRGRRCVVCDEVPGGVIPPSRRDILAVSDHCGDVVDLLLGHGLAFGKGRLELLPPELDRMGRRSIFKGALLRPLPTFS